MSNQQQITEDTIKQINTIAGKVVMLEADDIQTLGEILKVAEELELPGFEDYVEQVRRVAERLILDEYESPSVGLEELSSAVEQLQMATDNPELASEEQYQSKKEQLQQDENASGEESSESSDSQIVFNNDEEQKEKQQQDAAPAEEGASDESVGEQQTAADEDKPSAKNDVSAASIDEKDIEAAIRKYAENPDDPDLIIQTFQEDPSLVQGFIEESQENIQLIENGLLEWESNPDNLELVDSVFRPFHTIKGVAGFLNLSEINSFAHLYEDLLDSARKGEVSYNEKISEVVFEGVDALRQMVNAVAESSRNQVYTPHGIDIENYARRITEIRLTGNAPASRMPAREPSRQVQDSSAEQNKEAAQPSSDRPASSVQKMGHGDSSVKVNIEKMDNLIDLVGELVVTQNMVVENEVIKKSPDKRLEQDIGQLKRITSNLQDLSMSLRMVPVKDIFQKMHRIVRDLSRKSDKKIIIEMHGEQTEIDRNMVDELYEPLVHVIRNNCDHGIETPEVRRKAGKSETGTVMLNAFYRGGLVVIEITDDGAGIDIEAIKKKAASRGLCHPDDDLSDQQILQFIFESGFSTTENVSNVSGRGVGMDVVKQAIDRLRGNVEITTKQGRGTTFSLRLPLTLAIIDGVIVKVGSEQYIIPTISIKESLIPEKKNFKTIAGKGESVLIRDRVLPLLRLNRIFEVPDGIENPEEGLLMIVESDGREAAILIDELHDKQEIVIKSLGESLNQIEGLAGGAILADGNIGLIIDISSLLPKEKMRFKSE